MNRKKLIILGIIIAVVVAGFGIAILVLRNRQQSNIGYHAETNQEYARNMLTVAMNGMIDLEKAGEIAGRFDAEITESAWSRGFAWHRFEFNKFMNYDELNDIIEKLKEYEDVEDAFHVILMAIENPEE